MGETERERERVGKQFYILQPLHHNITQNWENLRTSKLLSSSSPSGWASPTWERPQHPAGPASGPQKPHDVRRAGAALGPRAGALDGEIIGKSWELQGTCAIFLKYGLNIWRNFARWLNRDLLVWKCERHLENHGARSCINHSICGQKADNSCLMNIRAKRISKETKKMSHGNKMLCRAHGKRWQNGKCVLNPTSILYDYRYDWCPGHSRPLWTVRAVLGIYEGKRDLKQHNLGYDQERMCM